MNPIFRDAPEEVRQRFYTDQPNPPKLMMDWCETLKEIQFFKRAQISRAAAWQLVWEGYEETPNPWKKNHSRNYWIWYRHVKWEAGQGFVGPH